MDQVVGKYKKFCEEPLRRQLRKLVWAGGSAAWAASGRVTFVALSFTLGNIITTNMLGVDWTLVVGSTGILFFSLMSIGGATQNIPSIKKATAAASEIFGIIDEPSTLDIDDRNEDTVDDVTGGMIQFKEVSFKYPTRD